MRSWRRASRRGAAWQVAGALAVACLAGPGLAGDERPPPPPLPVGAQRPDWFLALARDGRTVQIVPLRDGRMPDLEAGVSVELPDDAQDPRLPPRLMILHDTDVLVLRTRRGGEAVWLRLRRDEAGRWRERAEGVWPEGWGPVGCADLDKDGQEDLLLLHREAPTGYAPYSYRVAHGQPDGTFRWGEPRPIPAGRQWNVVAALGDVNGDGAADLIYHVQPHGGWVPVELCALDGRGDGTFSAEGRAMIRGRTGASSIVPGRFTRGVCWEVYLAADDDVQDLGQGYLWRQDQQGKWSLVESLDPSPQDEGEGSDRGLWTAVASDVDLDGKLDLVATWNEWGGARSWRVVVHRGDGRGGFDAGIELMCARDESPGPALAWPPDAGP